MLSYSSVSANFFRIATDPEGIAKLHHLVEVLRTVAHPSVIGVERAAFGSKKAEVTLSASSSWRSIMVTTLSVEALTKITTSASAALAFVHEQNVVMGIVNTETLALQQDDSVVLCGFDTATFSTDAAAKQQDVCQLAQLVKQRLPASDPLRERINGTSESTLRESFIRILHHAENGSLDARQFAEKVRHAMWFDNTTPTRVRRKRRRSPGRRVVATTLTTLAVFAIVFTIRSQSNTMPPSATPKTPSCQLRTGTTLDVDQDGCPDTIEIGDTYLAINSERYAVGQPGDELVVGDWHCDGKPTLALLRPTTAEVFLFNEWPDAGRSAQPRKLAGSSAFSASALRARKLDDCDVIEYTTTNGTVRIDTKETQR